jgi:WD40 repeat protein
MSYCLNPVCQKPFNPDVAKFCQHCGSKLWLGDRYRAVKLIGQGGFGRTFLAQDTGADQTGLENSQSDRCVIKQLLPRASGIGPTKIYELFQQEVAQLTRLGEHPQIPQLLDHTEVENTLYLIQEYIEGKNLEEVLIAEGAFNESKIWDLLSDLLPVLELIHNQKIIHRDIKPENIIYSSNDSKPVLVDFGASKYILETISAKTGTVIGSAGYVAPEQAMGKAVFASDLYSLGICCIHLLTGMHPFDLYSVSEDCWVWKQYLPQPVTSRLRKVLDKLLQRAISQRYRTAEEVLQDLRPLSPLGIIRRTPAPGSQKRRNVSRVQWQCVRTLTGHTGEVTAISVSPSGRILASGSRDRTIKIWRLESGELLHTFAGRSLWSGAGHQDQINALAFSQDGRILFSASHDGSIKVWDLVTQSLISTLSGQGWDVSAIAIDPEGYLLVSGNGDGIIQLWDAETDELLANLRQHTDRISALAIDSQGHLLVSGSQDRTIRFWDLKTDQVIDKLQAHVDRVSALTLTPNASLLISASWDKTIKLWDFRNREQLRVISAHRDRIHSLAMHPTGQQFASASEDSTIKLWDIQTGDRLCTLRHAWGVNAIAFSPEGQRLISGSADETIRIWQLLSREPQ